MAALSGVSDRWIFDGHDAEAWIAAIAASEAGWIAWYDTGIPDFPLKFDVTLLNGRDPLDLARSLGRRLNCPVAVPDEQGHDPDRFLLLESDGHERCEDVSRCRIRCQIDVLTQPRKRDAHHTTIPYCSLKRTSPSAMSRMSCTSLRNIRPRSIPMPNAKPL